MKQEFYVSVGPGIMILIQLGLNHESGEKGQEYNTVNETQE